MISRLIAVLAAGALMGGVAATVPDRPGLLMPADSTLVGATLLGGESLVPGAELAQDRYTLVMQSDGNLVEYRDATALWQSGTSGHSGAHLDMQSDGNAVIYSAAGPALWWTGAVAGGHLVLQGDGNVVLYGTSGRVGWFSGLPQAPADLYNGQSLVNGQRLTSPSGQFSLVVQGNLVLSQRYGGTRGLDPEVPTWSSGSLPAQPTTSYLTMQADGNLVLYTSAGPVWQSGTAGRGSGEHLRLQDDGNLVVYAVAGHADWSSGTGAAVLNCGSSLLSGDALTNSLFGSSARLVMQTDGNLVLYKDGLAKWSSQTFVPGARLVYQHDGNLVIYTPAGRALWSSGTAGQHDPQSLVLSDSGYVDLDTSESTYWSVGPR